MNELVLSAINFRKTYKEEAIKLIQATLIIFFSERPIINKLQFFIDVGNRTCTYRDNPIVCKYNLLSINGTELNKEDYKDILGDLNQIFREAGIGLISLYGEGWITLCRKDFV